MARLDVDDANQLVSDLIGLLCSVGAMVTDLKDQDEAAPVLALVGHGLAAAGNSVAEWEDLGPIPPDHDYLPLFAHFTGGKPIPWYAHIPVKEPTSC